MAQLWAKAVVKPGLHLAVCLVYVGKNYIYMSHKIDSSPATANWVHVQVLEKTKLTLCLLERRRYSPAPNWFFSC